jgi:hypothetical protein
MQSECTVNSYLQKQQAILAFVLDLYTTKGVDQLVAGKLTPLSKLRYNALNDGIGECSAVELGVCGEVEVFR